eukprot:2349512-Lingulodinium_polyedra.AAC.1
MAPQLDDSCRGKLHRRRCRGSLCGFVWATMFAFWQAQEAAGIAFRAVCLRFCTEDTTFAG